MQLVLFLVSLVAIWFPNAAGANACTDGTDCYCDRVTNPTDEYYDPNLLLCEDWEALSLHENATPTARAGDGAPYYGPWYDDTGGPGYRGLNSWWTATYGDAASPCSFRTNTPDTIYYGSACAYGDCYAGEYSLRPSDGANIWSANSFACLDVVKDGEFDDEIASEGSGPLKPDGTYGVWDGQQTMGFRVPKGEGVATRASNRTGGITGEGGFGKAVTTLGLTMALAYSPNSQSSGIWNHAWKHDEYSGSEAQLGHWNLGRTGYCCGDTLPYRPFLLINGGQSACESALASASVSVGNASCSSVALKFAADPNTYARTRDFPWGTWGCHQAYISGLGTSNLSLRLWHNEVLIFEMTGFDGTNLWAQYYTKVLWNNFSNANQNLNEETPTSEATRRYQDNIHYTEGTPVSCNQIGFGAAPVAPVPTKTKGVNFGQGVNVN